MFLQSSTKTEVCFAYNTSSGCLRFTDLYAEFNISRLFPHSSAEGGTCLCARF